VFSQQQELLSLVDASALVELARHSPDPASASGGAASSSSGSAGLSASTAGSGALVSLQQVPHALNVLANASADLLSASGGGAVSGLAKQLPNADMSLSSSDEALGPLDAADAAARLASASRGLALSKPRELL